MVRELYNLDGDMTYVFMEAYRDGIRNAKKALGGDNE